MKNWEISFGFYPGLLLGFRTYKEELRTNHVLYTYLLLISVLHKTMSSSINKKILSDLTVHMKYAKFVPDLKRRETWEELVTRNKEMHQKRYPKLKEINR